MPDPNLPMLEDAVGKLAPFLKEIVFVGGVTAPQGKLPELLNDTPDMRTALGRQFERMQP